jgi:putative adhesin
MIPRPRFPIRTAWLAGPAILSLALVSAASFASDLCDEKEEWTGTYFDDDRGKTATDLQSIHEAAARGTWKIDCGENGSVRLLAWDKAEVLICAQVTAWTESGKGHPEEIVRAVRIETDGGRLRAAGPSQSNSARWAVSYKIYAPRRTDLDVVAANGGIAVEGIYGRMNLRSVNGPIAVRDVGGDVRGRTSNGPVSAHLSGSRWSGAGLDLETSNGPVQLSVPKGFSAELETGTQNGPMQVGFPVSMREESHGRISTVLGSGGPPVRVVTTNGPAVLARR